MIKIIFSNDQSPVQQRPTALPLMIGESLMADMMKEILCTIDFSEGSKEALKWSIETAKRLTAPLTILYTYRLLKHNGEAIATKKKIEEEAARNFAQLENELLIGSGLKYDFKTEIGFVADRVEEHSKKHPLTLLVMNKKMGTSNKETFDELVSNLEIPLVIVP